MSDQASRKRGRPRLRRDQGKLKRSQDLDQVTVDETFVLKAPGGDRAGEGCYITTTIHNMRYYGLLIDQDALKTASLHYFQDEASSLDLNRRMKRLLQSRGDLHNAKEPSGVEDCKRSFDEVGNNNDQSKRARGLEPDVVTSAAATSLQQAPSTLASTGQAFQVQKFRYVPSTEVACVADAGYRILLATFADVAAAANDDSERARVIDAACQAGGDFVGDYYYQYEVKNSRLEALGVNHVDDTGTMRMSMGFQSFLQQTLLPSWFPLSNLPIAQQKVLSILNMKKGGNGNAVWDNERLNAPEVGESGERLYQSLVPMSPRTCYRISVVGGGIAGLSSCLELLKEAEREGIELEVVLLEARSRVGGRLWTDSTTFQYHDSSTPFPVDLGASWIHGIDENPLASIARDAGVDFVRTSEEVTMLQQGRKTISKLEDDRAGAFFDKLLDLASDESWGDKAVEKTKSNNQSAVRWYAAGLADRTHGFTSPLAETVGAHRWSTDVSVDVAIGNVIALHKAKEFTSLSDGERHMLTWNAKNIEYALGANISDLSMKFWDIDERHAFEGDHVILKQGYSEVVEHMHRSLQLFGDKFKLKLAFPVKSIEYDRRTIAQTYANPKLRLGRYVDLSDTCRVTSESSGESIPSDFVVCAVPLGVLKASTQMSQTYAKRLQFEPELPFSKRDTIRSVGFGLLNKVYLQFPSPFWRTTELLGEDQTSFGNASGKNSHHYMFFDVGKGLHPKIDAPAILVTFISGKEAAFVECLDDDGVVGEVMETLRFLFSDLDVPNPVAQTITRWGSDPYAQGSYTFLPPGTTDQDFQTLQSPVNGNGDSLLLEGSETMRLFFAGEHTTALHPSMAHGALMSGVRVAKEVLAHVNFSFADDYDTDKLIPVTLFRHTNASAPVECCLCQIGGTSIREGTLLAFKRGSRQVLVHNNCAEYSPEVEVSDGQWSSVVKACNRGKYISCVLCGRSGATISCQVDECQRCYHFSCAEDTGWRFEDDGKEFFCDRHRGDERDAVLRVSMEFLRSSVFRKTQLSCALCGEVGDHSASGKLIGLKRKSRFAAVHEKCGLFTNIVDISPDSMSRFDNEFRNVFIAIDKSKGCEGCGLPGATIRCCLASCASTYHFLCAIATRWSFERHGKTFMCFRHRRKTESHKMVAAAGDQPAPFFSQFNHALFLEGRSDARETNHDVPDNAGEFSSSDASSTSWGDDRETDDEESCSRHVHAEHNKEAILTDQLEELDIFDSCLVGASRPSIKEPWNLSFHATPLVGTNKSLLSVDPSNGGNVSDGIEPGDIVTSINGDKIGSAELDTVEKVIARLGQEVSVLLEVQRQLG